MAVQHHDPDGLMRSRVFTQAISVTGPHRTVYVGGQDAVDASGNIVGRGDLRAQTQQIFHNLRLALDAGGARLEHVVKWNIYVLQGQALRDAFEVFQREWGARPNPPTISVVFISGLANPDFLVEVDAVAVVPE